jgi:protoporphyrinogen oxidase
MTMKSVLCIGAGPAGLTAGYLLAKRAIAVTVIERDPDYVGGISRTARYKGFHVDIGGHRFFSKSPEVEALWTEILGPDLLQRPRKSRIYYRGKLFDYPLHARDAILKLGVMEATACVLSYGLARLRPIANPKNFEEWVINQFGARLYRTFFRTYTEKVWGMKCTEISADWAAQRIKGLSLANAIWHACRGRPTAGARDKTIKTLIDGFRYPRRGPGMMWEAAAAKIRANGGAVRLGLTVVKSSYDATARKWTVLARDAGGRDHVFVADHVISSMSIRDLLGGLEPAPMPRASAAAQALRYRDFLMVAVIVKDRGRFNDNWIYIHDPHVKVARIQNFKSWSDEMVPEPSLNCYGLEYFCFAGDGLWTQTDDELLGLARDEIVQLGLADQGDVVDGCVIRQDKAYPIYDERYQENVETVRAEIESRYPNLHLVGRNGMHKYNNQDHAMMTAMLTVQNILADRPLYDVWRVNQDAGYHEATEARGTSDNQITPRLVPGRVRVAP